MTGGPIVILGASGQLGRSLVELAASSRLEVRGLTRDECDVTSPQALERAAGEAGLVVNCTAYTAVDKAEAEPGAAFGVNAEAPRRLAGACAERNVPLIHISTDYVFDGTGERPWREDDPVSPVNVYGRSKLGGEEGIRAMHPHHVILRTSWVFSPYGQNFVKTMLRLSATRPELHIVDDQRGGPTAAADIAAAILTIADRIRQGRGVWGTFHFSGAPATSWYGFAQAVLAGMPFVALRPIPSRDYPTPAERPRFSVLDCARIKATYDIDQPDWRPSLGAVLERLAQRGCG